MASDMGGSTVGVLWDWLFEYSNPASLRYSLALRTPSAILYPRQQPQGFAVFYEQSLLHIYHFTYSCAHTRSPSTVQQLSRSFGPCTVLPTEQPYLVPPTRVAINSVNAAQDADVVDAEITNSILPVSQSVSVSGSA